MKEWYAIIKAWQVEDDECWWTGWGTFLSEKVEAEDKKSARILIEEWYGQKFPMRIKSGDKQPNSLLLTIYEMKEGEYQPVHDMFKYMECPVCNSTFRKVELYNLGQRFSFDTCSQECSDKERDSEKQLRRKFEENWNESIPVIYKITQISTDKCYIGKTIRSFTLRWWEHIKSTCEEGSKFHKTLSGSDLTDWIFQVIEIVKSEDDILERETYWMNNFDSIENGFNSNVSKTEIKDESQINMELDAQEKT